jgi:hypothetical protein
MFTIYSFSTGKNKQPEISGTLLNFFVHAPRFSTVRQLLTHTVGRDALY